jgi:hypothetical protein
MAIFLLVALIIDGLMVWGLVKSWGKRRIDWRSYASFVGFIAAITAVTATALVLVVGAPHTGLSPAAMGFLFIAGSVAMISNLATILGGLLSRGVQRFVLVSCGAVVALTYLLAMVGHFGD